MNENPFSPRTSLGPRSSPNAHDSTATSPSQPTPSPEIAPKRRTVEEVLGELENVMDAEKREQEQLDVEDVAPATSKASPPTGRYGPQTCSVIGSNEKAAVLNTVIDLWNTLDTEPTADTPLIQLNELGEQELTFLRRGRNFALWAHRLGINGATKYARKLAKKEGRGFNGTLQEISEAVVMYNNKIMAARLLTQRTKKRKR